MIKLQLNYNNLAGPLPSEFGQLSALRVLNLCGNKLTGCIPAVLGQLGALKSLWLRGNQHQQLSGHEALALHLREHNPGCYFQ